MHVFWHKKSRKRLIFALSANFLRGKSELVVAVRLALVYLLTVSAELNAKEVSSSFCLVYNNVDVLRVAININNVGLFASLHSDLVAAFAIASGESDSAQHESASNHKLLHNRIEF